MHCRRKAQCPKSCRCGRGAQWRGRSSCALSLLVPPDHQLEAVLEALIARLNFERPLAPFDGTIHKVEMPAGDRAQLEEARAPAMQIIEVAPGVVRPFDAVRAGP